MPIGRIRPSIFMNLYRQQSVSRRSIQAHPASSTGQTSLPNSEKSGKSDIKTAMSFLRQSFIGQKGY
jgi:hypothetical protein